VRLDAAVVALLVMPVRSAVAAQERPIAAAPPAPSAATAPDTLPTLPGPAVRRIATAQAVSASTFGTIGQVRGLPDGRVLVNDVVARRLLLLDTLLGDARVVLDSLSERDNFYGVQPGIVAGASRRHVAVRRPQHARDAAARR
jgi:hypothetical protein